jgi:hypothetical protein
MSGLTEIRIKVVPHESQRYSTVGDWLYDSDGILHIKVSRLSDWRREMLIAVHELVEVLTCKNDGVSQAVVDKFDKDFEAARHPDNEDEPGDEPTAPYVKQHCLATGIERILAQQWGVNWKEYEQELSSLPPVPDQSLTG